MEITYELVNKVLSDLIKVGSNKIIKTDIVDIEELNNVCFFFQNKKGKIQYKEAR